jgi:uncharacterized protein
MLRKILAIECGGARGIIPARIVNHIEMSSKQKAGGIFSLIAGCGSGSILAVGLALGFAAETIEDFYREHAHEIYRGSWLSALLKRGPLNARLGDRLSVDGLRQCLRQLFGDRLFAACEIPALAIPSLPQLGTPFESWKSPQPSSP